MPDYTFYVEDYLGEDIPEKEFPRFIRRAGDELRRMREMYAVAPRQGLDPELAESMALCAVADAMYEFAQEDEARGVAKVSVGSVSETYTAPPELCSRTLADRAAHFRHEAGYYLRIGRWLPHEQAVPRYRDALPRRRGRHGSLHRAFTSGIHTSLYGGNYMKIERKYMAHYLNAAFGSGDASYTRLGSDLEEYSPELTANVEKKSNIVGETTVTINGYQKQGEVSPYYAEPGDPLFERLQAIIDGDLVLDDLKTDIVEVKLWDKDTAGAYPAVREECYIEVVSYGGDTTGYQIPFNVHYTGVKTKGTFDPATKKFTQA